MNDAAYLPLGPTLEPTAAATQHSPQPPPPGAQCFLPSPVPRADNDYRAATRDEAVRRAALPPGGMTDAAAAAREVDAGDVPMVVTEQRVQNSGVGHDRTLCGAAVCMCTRDSSSPAGTQQLSTDTWYRRHCRVYPMGTGGTADAARSMAASVRRVSGCIIASIMPR